jgi:serine-type D-Ala-D-Ala endopeptidase (penicillin-binding protein 7)
MRGILVPMRRTAKQKTTVGLYTALAVMGMVTLLLMSYTVLEKIPYESVEEEALLIAVPKVTASGWAVFDPHTGSIRYGNAVDEMKPIASITKLFTAYMVLSSGTGHVTTTITEDDIETEGSFGKLRSGETLSLASLMFPLLLESSNDAGAAIERTFGPLYADSVGGAIHEIGLSSTRIVDGTGLSPDDVSTARDLALFFSYLHATYPHITDITQLRMYITDARGLINNNPARDFSSFLGGKQGYIPEAGKTFVGAFSRAGGKGDVGIVLLGSSDLHSDIDRILQVLK